MNGQLQSTNFARCILAKVLRVTHIRHMLNFFSILLGIIALIIVIPSTIPLLGWGNWLALPFAVAGVGLGALSSTNGGRNFCLMVLAIAAIRLMLGGGII